MCDSQLSSEEGEHCTYLVRNPQTLNRACGDRKNSQHRSTRRATVHGLTFEGLNRYWLAASGRRSDSSVRGWQEVCSDGATLTTNALGL